MLSKGGLHLRFLHCTPIVSDSPSIVRQMQLEMQAATDMGLDWQVKVFLAKELSRGSTVEQLEDVTRTNRFAKFLLSRVDRRIRTYLLFVRWLRLEAQDFDAIVLRYIPHSPFLWLFMKRTHVPVVLVHHTNTLKQIELGTNRTSKLRRVLEVWIGNACIRESAITVGVTDEVAQLVTTRIHRSDLRTLTYPNGIIAKNERVGDSRDESPTLLFIAAHFQPWIGLDILIDWLEADPIENIRVQCVGRIPGNLRARAQALSNFELHGWLEIDEIRTLASNAWVGLAPLAMERVGLRESSALKTRELLAMGLPVAGTCKDVFPSDFPYYREVTGLRELIAFASSVRFVSRDDVSCAARPFIDKRLLLQKFRSDLLHELGE